MTAKYPDSDVGVAFALMLLILGGTDPTVDPRNKAEILKLFRECMMAVRDDPPPSPLEGMDLRTH